MIGSLGRGNLTLPWDVYSTGGRYQRLSTNCSKNIYKNIIEERTSSEWVHNGNMVTVYNTSSTVIMNMNLGHVDPDS